VYTIHPPAKSRIFEPAQEVKVFCFFSSEKKKESSFSEEKEAKRLYFLVLRRDACLAIISGHALE
jgi:hypothetical protein